MTTAFIPCRAGSERVPNKNTRPFGGFPGGLLELKLRQLDRVPEVDDIVISSDDPVVLGQARELQDELATHITPIRRPARFCTSSVSYSHFVSDYAAQLGIRGRLLWAQVTHPFMSSNAYEKVLGEYRIALERGCDSVATVTRVQECLWRDGAPFNYSPHPERWPRSQDIEPVWLFNHAAYVLSGKVLARTGDRLGLQPHFIDLPAEIAYDIDWPEEFSLADEIIAGRLSRSSESVL